MSGVTITVSTCVLVARRDRRQQQQSGECEQVPLCVHISPIRRLHLKLHLHKAVASTSSLSPEGHTATDFEQPARLAFMQMLPSYLSSSLNEQPNRHSARKSASLTSVLKLESSLAGPQQIKRHLNLPAKCHF